ncbi:MAG: substrate-binding domain-containing protein [Chloroflexi bacterium]|nr:substrate-binding domain-containing protein [Chloroflexota bacterium]
MRSRQAKPLYSLIVEDIAQKIASGALKPGDKLVSERMLCEQYGVSQITVRRALRELAIDGYLYSRHGLGWFVNERSGGETFGRHAALLASGLDAPLAVVVKRVSEALMPQQVPLRVAFAPDDWAPRKNLLEQVAASGAALILLTVEGEERTLSKRYAHLLEGLDVPTLFLLRDVPDLDVPAVVLDEQAAMERLTHHVLELGHRHIAYVGIDPSSTAGWRRYRGFANTLWAEGLELPLDWVFSAPLVEGAEAARFCQAMEARQRPSAIVCATDAQAAQAMALLRSLGLHCPHDVAIAALEDSPFDAWLPSPLTTFRFDLESLASQTASLAQALLAGSAVQSVRITGELIVRESCGAALKSRSS